MTDTVLLSLLGPGLKMIARREGLPYLEPIVNEKLHEVLREEAYGELDRQFTEALRRGERLVMI